MAGNYGIEQLGHNLLLSLMFGRLVSCTLTWELIQPPPIYPI
jgi:hypothetical protein